MLDTLSFRFVAGVCGLLLGVAGVFGLLAALCVALASTFGIAVALFTCAVLAIAVSGLSIWLAFHAETISPSTKSEAPGHSSSIPGELLHQAIDEHPLTTMTIGTLLGFIAAENPEHIADEVSRLLGATQSAGR